MNEDARKTRPIGSGDVVKRKVQVTGGSTYIVSLPKEWVKFVGLKHGSEVSIDILPDYSLRLHPITHRGREGPRERIVSIDVESLPIAIIEILSAYLAGYSMIRLKYEGVGIGDVLRIIESARSKAIGLEVFEEKSNEIILYIIVDTSSLSLREAVEKLTNTTRSMLDDVITMYRKQDRGIVQNIVERDNVVDKLFLLAMRQLNQILMGKLSPSAQGLEYLPQALSLVIFLKSVERIADHTVLVARYFDQAGALIGDERLGVLLKKTRDVYVDAVKGFRRKERQYAIRVLKLLEEAKRVDEELREALARNSRPPASFLVLDSLRRIRAYSLDIVEATVNSVHVGELLSSYSS